MNGDPRWCNWQARDTLNVAVEVRVLGGEP